MHKAKVGISVATLSLMAATAGFSIVYPITQKNAFAVVPNEIVYADGSSYKYSSIKMQHTAFSYLPEYEEIEEEVAVEEVPIDISLGGELNSNYSTLSQQCNLKLYDLCSSYFLTKWDGKQLSPLYPMALANNESAIRADKNITFTSLYPSGVIVPSSPMDIENFSTINVLESSDVFNELAADWWTRDRGPVQMMATYGVHRGDKYYNMLGESESNLLNRFLNLYNYTAYTTKEGIITADTWIEKSSTERGDRFNVKDICLRLSSETSYALETIEASYSVPTERLAMVMLSMYHGAGSLWNREFTDKEIGYWRSGNIAYKYAQEVSSDAAYSIIYSCAREDVLTARINSTNPDVGISIPKAKLIYNKLQSEGIISNIEDYTVAGTYREDYIVYPIKLLYNFAQLQILYNGG